MPHAIPGCGPLAGLLERGAWLRHPTASGWAPAARRRRSGCLAAAAGRPGSAAGGAAAGAASTSEQCYFRILGLQRTASKEEVKQAYRRLARQWHPDVNGGSAAAAARFAAISRAYEVLSDELQRQQYERARHGGRSRQRAPGAAGGGGGEQPPADIHAVLQLGFREAALGAQRAVVVQALDACLHCGGSGAQPGSRPPPCGMCKGRREIVKRQPSAGGGSAGSVLCCPICRGRGYQVTQPCSCCRGAGLMRQPRQVSVQVPAGVDDGMRLHVPAEGDVGRVGGPRGAVVLELQVAGEEGISRRGLDLHSQLAVPLWDALLGGTATVRTLRGKASLPIPPGTQHGAVLSLRQAGVHRDGGGPGSRGTHHFEVLVHLPRQVSGAEQELLQRLAELQRQRRPLNRRSGKARDGGG